MKHTQDPDSGRSAAPGTSQGCPANYGQWISDSRTTDYPVNPFGEDNEGLNAAVPLEAALTTDAEN